MLANGSNMDVLLSHRNDRAEKNRGIPSFDRLSRQWIQKIRSLLSELVVFCFCIDITSSIAAK